MDENDVARAQTHVQAQQQCEHDFAEAPDKLDAMCRKCHLYVMSPTCVAETLEWIEKKFGEGILWA